MTRSWLVVSIVLALLVGCGSEPTLPDGVTVADGLRLEVVAEGFDRPTQIAPAGDGRWVIGELAGAENDATGRVLLVGLDDGERTVLQTGLDKPTGVAVRGNDLFVMQRDRLSRTALEPAATLETVVGDLPNNGRSQGSLTLTGRGELLYDTSGRKRGAERTDGSGLLLALPEGDDTPRTVAEGFKHAYAHVEHPDGSLFTVEMTDGTFDGERGQDELVIVSEGDDGGWPQCVDDNRPVIEFGGTADGCAESPRSHALFGPGATPTAVVVAPWDASTLLVALWIPGTIVSVPVEAGDRPHEPTVVVDGLESPQSLAVDGDRVLVVDHETGTVFALAEG